MTKLTAAAVALLIATAASPAAAANMSGPSVNPSEAISDATTAETLGVTATASMAMPMAGSSAIATNDGMMRLPARSTVNPIETGNGETAAEQILN